MTILERIENDIALQMALSELLHKALDMGCWHEWKKSSDLLVVYWGCQNCHEREYYQEKPKYGHPNLFTRSAFLDVFEAVTKIEGWADHLDAWFQYEILEEIFSVPHFQFKILEWLLEKDGRGEELERVLGK